jgi:hypothetical protein
MDTSKLTPLVRGSAYKISGSETLHQGIQIDGRWYMQPEHSKEKVNTGINDRVVKFIMETPGKTQMKASGKFGVVKKLIPAPMVIVVGDLLEMNMNFTVSIFETDKKYTVQASQYEYGKPMWMYFPSNYFQDGGK